MRNLRLLLFASASLLSPGLLFGQQPSSASPAASVPEDKRILWIVPNFRTSTLPTPFKPLTPKEKFAIATADSFDRGTIGLAVIFGAESQLSNSEPAFGHGAGAYARSIGSAYGDFLIGDYLTEGVFPILLHQDPRYFRRGTGGKWARLGYAAGQIFVTRTDSGRKQFNYSEVVGNSAAVAISMAYYPDGRDASSAVSKLGAQLAVDMASNVLKEFWPDLRRKLSPRGGQSDSKTP